MRQLILDEVIKTQELLAELLASEALLQAFERAARLGIEALENGRKIMFCGNGGSAADSQHLAAELVSRLNFDRPGLAALALTTDSSILTAIGNDYGYEKVFARQIEAIAQKGDVLVDLHLGTFKEHHRSAQGRTGTGGCPTRPNRARWPRYDRALRSVD